MAKLQLPCQMKFVRTGLGRYPAKTGSGQVGSPGLGNFSTATSSFLLLRKPSESSNHSFQSFSIVNPKNAAKAGLFSCGGVWP
jgi:hypothetical protein